MNTTFDLEKKELLDRAAALMQAHVPDGAHTLRERIALTCRILFDDGQGVGLAGQITARGEQPGSYWTQRFGLGFDEIRADNLLRVDADLQVLEGSGMPNPANRFHSWIYGARPEVQCIVHTHAPHAAALGMLEQPLQIAQMDNCLLYDDVAFVGHWPGVPFGNEEGRFITDALGGKRAVLLSHHGLLVAGGSVEESCLLALAFERAARLQLLAAAAGALRPIPPERGREAHDWMLKPKNTAASFGYLARRCLARHADALG